MIFQGKQLRNELKYYINYEEYFYLKNRLATMLKIDENSIKDYGYHIRSLYFDDMYGTALKEKEAGVMYRKKYRVRIYDKEDKNIKLERKDKYGEYITKLSERITRDQFYELINGGNINFLLDSGSQLKKDMYVNIRTRLLRPAVIVDYERETYVLNEGNVRITFDKKIQAGINTPDIFSRDIINVDVLPPNTLVLEVKFDDFLPDYVRKLLRIPSYERCAISKYVLCRLIQLERNPVAKDFFMANRIMYTRKLNNYLLMRGERQWET